MSEVTPLAVARDAWEKWVAGDLEGFLGLWNPTGVWTMGGHSRLSGAHRGVDEMAKMARAAFELSGGTLKARPVELASGGEDSVLACFHVAAQRSETTIDQFGLQRMVVRAGKIVSLVNLFCNEDEFDSFYQ
jgi:ketosteroid isomerase-like protein